MLSTATFFAKDYPSNTTAIDIIREHRARVALEEEERREKRRAAQAEQHDSSSTPDVRIRVWEKLHGLRLPADAAHPILVLIAAQTHLSVAEIQQEQCVRKSTRA
jgi:hypothetical protein